MLRYSKESSAGMLKDFECGIPAMDVFIHESLDVLIKKDSRYDFYVAEEEGLGLVAMFVISRGGFLDRDEEFDDLPFGKPWSYVGEDSQMHSGTLYPTIEIDYLAVRKDLRGKGYGSEILAELSKIAQITGCYFLTVDAYHDAEYSAIPFYEKKGFFPLQEFSEDYDTLRMAYRV